MEIKAQVTVVWGTPILLVFVAPLSSSDSAEQSNSWSWGRKEAPSLRLTVLRSRGHPEVSTAP